VIEIRTESLSKVERIPYQRGAGSIYMQAQAHYQRHKLELTLDEKLRVIENLKGFDVKVDVSGGDALAVGDTPIILAKLAETFGRKNVTLTVTGAGSHGFGPKELAPVIGEFNFTYDGEPIAQSQTRPVMYARGNLKKAQLMAQAGVATRGEVPLSRENIDPSRLEDIFLAMHDAGIDKLLAMRLFSVGRGTHLAHQIPGRDEYRCAIRLLRQLEARYGRPAVNLQCALRRLDPDFDPAGPNPCDALTESLGLTADGTLLISPWAVNAYGVPLHKSWVLGNLAASSLGTLLGTDRVARLRVRANENHGACKIFAWLNSPLPKDDDDRFFGETDPLYA
jgi:MoaA/NifB/PqqE/SkfB family radical SAM enzyme